MKTTEKIQEALKDIPMKANISVSNGEPSVTRLAIDINSLLPWGDPKQVHTKLGLRTLRKAVPTEAFWSVWRSQKSELQAAGISVSQYQGQWEVCLWEKIGVSTSQETPQTASAIGATAHSEPEAGSNPQKGIFKRPGANKSIDPGSRVWSDEQLVIFQWFKSGTGHLVVQARAGTGKTTTIKAAFERAPEQSMLYAVFNRKNMKEAVEKITDQRVDVKTLHSLGYSFIQEFWPGSKPDDEVEGDRVRTAAGKTTVPDEVVSCVERLVGFAKNLYIGIPSAGELKALAEDKDIFAGQWEDPENGGWTVDRLAELARASMETAKTKDSQNRISFNDMVWLPVAMGWAHPRYDLVVIDEAQDMSVPQLFMARRACNENGRICVVGDERQCIYHFRGCAQDGMEMMRKELNAAVLGLTTTYRCPKRVVELAAAIVNDYKAAPQAPEGIVDTAQEFTLSQTVKVGDAILSRVNAPLMPLCLTLIRKGVPARIEGRDVGKQLAGMVKRLNAKSVPDFLRKLTAWADKGVKRAQCGSNEAKIKNKVEQIRDQQDTLVAVAEGAASVFEIEKRLRDLFQDSDQNSKPAVVLSSVHKAKGLEFPRVYLLRDTFRRGRPGQSEEEAKQEQNVYYVAITRAKEHLTMVTSGGQLKGN